MPSTDGRSFTERLGSGWQRATTHLPLAAVPVLSSILDIDSVQRILSTDGFRTGLTFRFPTAIADLWTFVSLPSQGPGLHVSPTLRYLPLLVLVQAVLVAGYLGSIEEVRQHGDYDFWRNAKRYFARVLGYELVVWLPTLALTGVAFLGYGSPSYALPGFALFAVPAYLILSYLFYATPYLLVVRDTGLLEAFSRSFELATDGGPYLGYAGGYLLVVASASLVVTVIATLGAIGIVVGAALTAPLALALSFATTEFVADLAA